MGIYIEALILYIILFFAGSVRAIWMIPAETAAFSVYAEISKICLYSLPSIALILYLIAIRNPKWHLSLKPCKNDLISVGIALPCLLITGFIVSFAAGFVSEPVNVIPAFPSETFEWIILSISCIFAAYLEEFFFRYYLITKRKDFKLGQVQILIISTLLFAACHVYEGPWGFLNAIIAGGILAFLFLRYRSLHGIAVAHGLYNIAVFIINS